MYYHQSVNIYSPQAVYTTFREQESSITINKDKINLVVSDEQAKMLQDSSKTIYSWISSIEQTAHEIALSVSEKTSGDEIVSSINIYPGKIKINSDKIDLSGYATFSALKDDDGATIINGGNIKTGTITITSRLDSGADGIFVVSDGYLSDPIELIRIDDDGFKITHTMGALLPLSYTYMGSSFFGGIVTSEKENGTGWSTYIDYMGFGCVKDGYYGGSSSVTTLRQANSCTMKYNSVILFGDSTDSINDGSILTYNHLSIPNGAVSAKDGTFTGILYCTGTKSRLVSTEDYSDRLLYCYETPSPLFGDVGCGIIAEDGYCYIQIDPVFSETIQTTEYQVFLQNYGDGSCYVYARYPSYFIVCGTPNMEFGWELKAKQLDYTQNRLDTPIEDVDMSNSVNYATEANNYIKELTNERVNG